MQYLSEQKGKAAARGSWRARVAVHTCKMGIMDELERESKKIELA